jgi:hypothetical protein
VDWRCRIKLAIVIRLRRRRIAVTVKEICGNLLGLENQDNLHG